MTTNRIPLPSTKEINGVLDTVSVEGTAEGWALSRTSNAPVHVQLRVDGRIVGEDVADKFRADLMQAGLGHGHYAFYATIVGVPPGVHDFFLFDGRSGQPIGTGAPVRLTVPIVESATSRSVNDMTVGRPSWSAADLISKPECLQLGRNCAQLGPDRFVDRVFQFALGRWADPAGAAHYSAALQNGSMTADEVLLAVLGSAERELRPVPFPRPFDGSYPFSYDGVAGISPFGDRNTAPR